MNLLINTAEAQLEAIEENGRDFRNMEESYDYTDPDSLENAIDSSRICIRYLARNAAKLSVTLRLIGAEMLLQSEGYEEKLEEAEKIN